MSDKRGILEQVMNEAIYFLISFKKPSPVYLAVESKHEPNDFTISTVAIYILEMYVLHVGQIQVGDDRRREIFFVTFVPFFVVNESKI